MLLGKEKIFDGKSIFFDFHLFYSWKRCYDAKKYKSDLR